MREIKKKTKDEYLHELRQEDRAPYANDEKYDHRPNIEMPLGEIYIPLHNHTTRVLKQSGNGNFVTYLVDGVGKYMDKTKIISSTDIIISEELMYFLECQYNCRLQNLIPVKLSFDEPIFDSDEHERE